MVSAPPEYALLRRGHGDKRQQELKHPVGLERAVREIAVIACRHADHPEIIAADGEQQVFRLHSGLKCPQAHGMDAQKGNDVPLSEHVFPVVILGRSSGAIGNRVHAETFALSGTWRRALSWLIVCGQRSAVVVGFSTSSAMTSSGLL